MLIPAFGVLIAICAITSLIRVVAGGSLAIHGYPILSAIKRPVLESVGSRTDYSGPIVGTVECAASVSRLAC